MSINIQLADFGDPALERFLQEHLDDLAPTAPSESRHALGLHGLQGDGVRLWVAYDDEIVGTGALVELEPGHEEIKSMRTAPACRGRGIARQLLEFMLADAADRGVEQISLETGSMEFFAPARALYASVGFVECAPFADYHDDPYSTFMTRELLTVAA